MENTRHVTLTRRLKCHEHQLPWSSIKGTTRWMAGRRSVTQWALKRQLRKWRDLWDFARRNFLLHLFYKQTNRPVLYLKESVLADHGMRHHWIWSITEKMAESDSLATLTKVIRNNKKNNLTKFLSLSWFASRLSWAPPRSLCSPRSTQLLLRSADSGDHYLRPQQREYHHRREQWAKHSAFLLDQQSYRLADLRRLRSSHGIKIVIWQWKIQTN